MVGLSCRCSVLVRSDLDSQSAGPEFEPSPAYQNLSRAGLCIIRQSGATRINNPRVGQVRLPNEPNQSISYFLRVFRVTGQILVQKPLLITKPPY